MTAINSKAAPDYQMHRIFRSACRVALEPQQHPPASDQYALATGEDAAYRLRILDNVYGEGTRRLLLRAGLRWGMRVADLGCGVGMVTARISELIGPNGRVVGVDLSAGQLEQAQKHLAQRKEPLHGPATFVSASAADTGLPSESFDLVYCRFLLLHLRDPHAALLELHRLLKPDGVLVVEDGDLTSAFSEPPSALDAFADLWSRLGPERGLDYTLGRRLYGMVLDAGFPEPEVNFNQPAMARGENKRLLELTVAEAGVAFVKAGLISPQELKETLARMREANADETVLAVMPRMTQVWARKVRA